jgi:hypothetical protein
MEKHSSLVVRSVSAVEKSCPTWFSMTADEPRLKIQGGTDNFK